MYLCTTYFILCIIKMNKLVYQHANILDFYETSIQDRMNSRQNN